MVKITLCSISALAVLATASHAPESQAKQEPLLNISVPATLEEQEQFVCQDPPYRVHVFSKKPLVIYISDFITQEERVHLMNLDESKFEASLIRKNGVRQVDAAFRSSSSAFASPDVVTTCIEARAKAFQGYGQAGDLEPLQVVKYSVSEEFKHHFDWSVKNNRETTFFAYLHTNCTGGGTNFPRLSAPPDADEKWCEFIDCDESFGAGVTFKPLEGNAIFWQNIDVENGQSLYPEALHAGLPVTSGKKVGLNIWTKTVAASLEGGIHLN